jgi:hypothetical protein
MSTAATFNNRSLLKDPDEYPAERLAARGFTGIDCETGAIAYFLACSTAENSAPCLMNEVIRVAGSSQLAGFSHFIGYPWSVHDDISVDLAEAFCRLLSCYSNEKIEHNAVTHASHGACTLIHGFGLDI